MRVLHLLDIPWHSGLADYAIRLACVQASGGDEVVLAAPPGTTAWAAAQAAGLSLLPAWRLRDLPALRGEIRRRRVEIVNAHTGAAHTLALIAVAAPGRVAGSRRAPAVVRTRADARPVRRRLGASLARRGTARYIGATEAIRRQLVAELGVPPGRAHTVYPAVELPAAWEFPAWSEGNGPAHRDAGSHGAAAASGASRAAPPSGSGPVLTVLARLDPVKGHRVFLEAAAHVRAALPSARFVFAGRQERVAAADLRAEAERLGLADALDVAGHVPDLGPLRRDTTVGVIPSLGSEAVSRAALEWMAAGRPVVASAVGGLAEFVEHGRTGVIVPPGNAGELSAALLSLLLDRPRLREMAAAARRRAEERFSGERLRHETARIYSWALEPAAAGMEDR